MPNYLYPIAIQNYINHKLKGIPKNIVQHQLPLLIRYVNQQTDCAIAIDILPTSAPTWAFDVHKISTLHAFIPSDALNSVINNIVSFTKEILLIDKFSDNHYAQQYSQRVLTILTRGNVGDILKEQQQWFNNRRRSEILAGIYENNEALYLDNGHWIECQSLQQMHHWGQKLGQGCCLATDHHDNDFLHPDNSFRVFGLFDNQNKLTAVASFFHGDLDDFEGCGSTRVNRQQQAQLYKTQLYQLLINQDLYVNRDSHHLIERTNICEQSPLDEALFENNHFTLWLDEDNDIYILYHHLSQQYSLLDNEPLWQDDDTSWQLLSFSDMLCHHQRDHQKFTEQCGEFLSLAVKSNAIDCDYLTQFNEFSAEGHYWKKNINAKSIQTKIGIFVEYDGQAWWLNNEDNRLYRWYDDSITPHYDHIILDNIHQQVKNNYSSPKSFWNTLFKCGIYLPDIYVNQDKNIELTYTTYNDKVLTPADGWQWQENKSNDEYNIYWRDVDHYHGQSTQQWICENNNNNVAAAILVTQLSARKKQLSMNTLGRDPSAFAALSDAINTNDYTAYDHYLAPTLFGKQFSDCFIKNSGYALSPTEIFTDIPFSYTKYHRLIYIFNLDNEIDIVFKTDNANNIIDAEVFGDSAILRDYFYAIIAQLPQNITPQFDAIARAFNYRVVDSRLEPLPSLPTIDFDDIDMDINEDDIFIGYDDGDLSTFFELTLSRKDDVLFQGSIDYDNQERFNHLQYAVAQSAEFLDISLPTDIEKALGLIKTTNGYRLTTSLPPQDWSLKSNDNSLYWLFDDQISNPVIMFKDGNIACDHHHYDNIFNLKDNIKQFINWYNC